MIEGSHRSAPARAGSPGLAVVTPHAVVVLPAGAAPRVVEDVWRILAGPSAAAESIVAARSAEGSSGWLPTTATRAMRSDEP